MKRVFLLSMVLMVLLLMAVNGWAASAEGGSWAEWKDFLWRIVNFIIFIGIIYLVAGKRMIGFFTGRSEQIQSELKDLNERRVQAEERLQEVEKSIANIDQEREEILNKAREQGDAMRESIISKAREEAEQITRQAQVKASQEMQQVVNELREEMADKVIDSAEKLIVSKLGKKDQERLIDKYLTKVVLN
ncbi:MAG: F0F1 ATP synthase subunit B [Desulfohalobiaceae bacterium]